MLQFTKKMKAVRHGTTAIVTKETAIAVATILDANANYGSIQAELSASQISHLDSRGDPNEGELSFLRASQ